jgi:FkbM family methyltransferase
MKASAAQLLTRSYAVVKRSGLLETSIGSEVFTSAYFLYKRYIEDDLHGLLQLHPNLVRRGNVLDIGANVGYTATVLATATAEGQLVYAFEPEPANYNMLRRVAARPKARNRIVAVQCAVGAEERMARLWINEQHHGDHKVITEHFLETARPPGITVPMVTIDAFVERHPGPVGFVKIDVQGLELPVCAGMTKTLEQNPDVTIVLEYAPSSMTELGLDPAELLRFLAARGFDCYLIGSRGKLSRTDVPAIESGDYVDLLFSRRPIAGENS